MTIRSAPAGSVWVTAPVSRSPATRAIGPAAALEVAVPLEGRRVVVARLVIDAVGVAAVAVALPDAAAGRVMSGLMLTAWASPHPVNVRASSAVPGAIVAGPAQRVRRVVTCRMRVLSRPYPQLADPPAAE